VHLDLIRAGTESCVFECVVTALRLCTCNTQPLAKLFPQLVCGRERIDGQSQSGGTPTSGRSTMKHQSGGSARLGSLATGPPDPDVRTRINCVEFVVSKS
jgi:hypothetical protein